MRININGMHFNEIAWLMGRLERLHLSTRLDILGDEIVVVLSADGPEVEQEIEEEIENGFERTIIEYDKDNTEEIDVDNICF